MRTVELEVRGDKHPLCFSARAATWLSERYGGLRKMGDVLSGDDIGKVTSELLAILEQLMKAGRAYYTVCGRAQELPDPIDADAVLDLMGVEDLSRIVTETILSGSQREVEVAPEKNGGPAALGT